MTGVPDPTAPVKVMGPAAVTVNALLPLIVPPNAIAPPGDPLVSIVNVPPFAKVVGTTPPTVNEPALKLATDAPNANPDAPLETVKAPIGLVLPTSPSIVAVDVVVSVRFSPAPSIEWIPVLAKVMELAPVLTKTGAVNVTGIVDWVAKEVLRYTFPPKLNALPEVKTSPIGVPIVPMLLPKVMPLEAPACAVRVFPPEAVTAPVIVIAAEAPPLVVFKSTFIPIAVGPVSVMAPFALVVILAPFKAMSSAEV